jgi:NADP-dependent 3-hydroxy acid dehydrogenase YdfG
MLGGMSTTEKTGRVAVITGASSGIGEATARSLTADGYRVALLARRAERIQALADELGDGAIAVPADVTDREALVAAAGRVQDELGPAHVLVNNAGVMLLAPFGPDQREDYRRMIEVNLLGAITATELTDHITDDETKQCVEQFYADTAITAADIAEIIAFAVGRPRRVALKEILVRPAVQA